MNRQKLKESSDETSKTVNHSLHKIVRGTGIITIGTILGMFFGFISQVIIIRYLSQYQFGIFSLTIVITGIAMTISNLGMQDGLTRFIASFRGKNEKEKVNIVISSTFKILIIFSIIISLIIFILSDVFSDYIFLIPELSYSLKILSLSIIYSVLINIFISIFRGHDKVEPNIYFQNIFKNIVYLILISLIIWLNLSLVGILYAYLFSIIISFVFFFIYTFKKGFLKKISFYTNKKSKKITKKLLFFSIPLLGSSILNSIFHWTDTMLIGFYKTAETVGLYNAVLPLTSLLIIALSSASFIYVPIASGLFSKNLISELKRTYQILTKWIFFITIPIFFILFLFPETVLNLFFGYEYIEAAVILRILSIGFITHTIVGLNGLSLLVMGNTKFLMFASFVSALFNVILNIILIPSIGIIGAAIASLASYFLINILKSIKLYKVSKIHPFTKNYLKPLTINLILFLLIFISTKYIDYKIWMLPILLSIYLVCYTFLLLFTKSFEAEDVQLILAIERKTGFKLNFLKKLLNRYI